MDGSWDSVFKNLIPFFSRYTDARQRLPRETKKYESGRSSKERLLPTLMNVDCYPLPRLIEPKTGSALKKGKNRRAEGSSSGRPRAECLVSLYPMSPAKV